MVEITEVKNAGLMALVQGTIKVVIIIAGLIACRTRSFPSSLEKGVWPLFVTCSLPGGLQRPRPIVPLRSGLRFRGWQG